VIETSEEPFRKYIKYGAYHYKAFEIVPRKDFLTYLRYKVVADIICSKFITKTKKKPIMFLDIGCGDGAFIYYVTKSRKDVNIDYIVGLDISPQGLKLAKRILKEKSHNSNTVLDLVLGDGCNLPFRSGVFSIVTSLEVIEHIENYETLLHEIKNVLKKGCSLVLTTPNAAHKGSKDPYHYKEFLPSELKASLEKTFCKTYLFGFWSLRGQNVIYYLIENAQHKKNKRNMILFKLMKPVISVIIRLLQFMLYFSTRYQSPQKSFILVAIVFKCESS